MRLCIDASNIRTGGGLTHLTELLRAADPSSFGFAEVIVWASTATLSQLEDRPWLRKRHEPVLEKHAVLRGLWQRQRLGQLARADRSDLLFAPGGTVSTSFKPVVTMSRNMLPFDLAQLARFGFSRQAARLLTLRWLQTRSIRAADGVVFLTSYAKSQVTSVTGPLHGRAVIIPHGVDAALRTAPAYAKAVRPGSAVDPLRLVYVSIIDVYKNQPQVAEAVHRLRAAGEHVALEFIGPAYPPALRRLQRTLARLDPDGTAIHYSGPMSRAGMAQAYAAADIAVFASSCENMPNILLESMAAGLPVACSDRGPMPEVLGDSGIYFDPTDPSSIARALAEFVHSPDLRAEYARRAYQRATQYSWPRCADETFAFMSEIARARGQRSP